jgi:hypothetical protein
MNWSYITTFLSGGFAGAVFKHLIDTQRNKIQVIQCHYTDDEIISKIPVTFSIGQHENLYKKDFKIINTTNKDIAVINITFTFEPAANITKVQVRSKWGLDVPKGKIKSGKKNEYILPIKNFNRRDEIEIIMEIANLNSHDFNVQDSNCSGFRVEWLDKRQLKANKTIKMVKKVDLE